MEKQIQHNVLVYFVRDEFTYRHLLSVKMVMDGIGGNGAPGGCSAYLRSNSRLRSSLFQTK